MLWFDTIWFISTHVLGKSCNIFANLINGEICVTFINTKVSEFSGKQILFVDNNCSARCRLERTILHLHTSAFISNTCQAGNAQMSCCTFEWHAEKEAQIGAVIVPLSTWESQLTLQDEPNGCHRSQLLFCQVTTYYCTKVKHDPNILEFSEPQPTLDFSENVMSINIMLRLGIVCHLFSSLSFPPTFSILKVSNSHLLPDI